MSAWEARGAMRYVIMGVSGAGKTAVGERFASALHVPFVDGDALHPPDNIARMSAGIPLTDIDRRGWLQTIAARLRDARARDEGLVVACSALKRRYRDVLRDADPDVRFIHLAGPRSLLGERLSHRSGHFMPAALLDSQFEALEEPSADEEAWKVDVSAPIDTIVSQLVARVVRARGDGAPDPDVA